MPADDIFGGDSSDNGSVVWLTIGGAAAEAAAGMAIKMVMFDDGAAVSAV